LHLLTSSFLTVTDGFVRAAIVRGLNKNNSRYVMKARITDDGRFLGLDLADWSMLVVGFTLAGLLSLYI
jgi:hypothetical protein